MAERCAPGGAARQSKVADLTDAEKIAVEVCEFFRDGRLVAENGPASAAMLRLCRSLPDEAFRERRFINGG